MEDGYLVDTAASDKKLNSARRHKLVANFWVNVVTWDNTCRPVSIEEGHKGPTTEPRIKNPTNERTSS